MVWEKGIITVAKHPSSPTNEINSYVYTCSYCIIRQKSVGDGGLTLCNTEPISAQKEVGGAESEAQLHEPLFFLSHSAFAEVSFTMTWARVHDSQTNNPPRGRGINRGGQRRKEVWLRGSTHTFHCEGGSDGLILSGGAAPSVDDRQQLSAQTPCGQHRSPPRARASFTCASRAPV